MEDMTGTRSLVIFINWWMWFGQTLIIVMAGITAIPTTLYEAALFFAKQYLEAGIIPDLIDAARIDGASEIGIYHRVMIPLAIPGMVTWGIFSFVGSWNNFFTPLIPNDVRDSSAASVLAAGLLNLASLENDSTLASIWQNRAISILESLWQKYTSRNTSEASLLLHGTRSKPHHLMDHGLIYGRIINLTSGIKDIPQLVPYSVSKAAVDKYSCDLAAELRGTNVLVNYLDPGWLRTDLGGPNADHAVETVLPGALVPALLENDGPTGRFYAAQDYSDLGC